MSAARVPVAAQNMWTACMNSSIWGRPSFQQVGTLSDHRPEVLFYPSVRFRAETRRTLRRSLPSETPEAG